MTRGGKLAVAAGASVVSGRLIINNNHFYACSVDAIVHGEREH